MERGVFKSTTALVYVSFVYVHSLVVVLLFPEELLNNFAQQIGAWRFCLYFLSSTRNDYVMMYSLTVFEVSRSLILFWEVFSSYRVALQTPERWCCLGSVTSSHTALVVCKSAVARYFSLFALGKAGGWSPLGLGRWVAVGICTCSLPVTGRRGW